GLDETGERGAEPKYTTATNKRILALLDQTPPEGYARWTGPLLAAALDDVDVQYVWRFLRAQKIDLAGRKSWCESNDPAFVAKAADVVGLYMAPPENAIVRTLSLRTTESIDALGGKLDALEHRVDAINQRVTVTRSFQDGSGQPERTGTGDVIRREVYVFNSVNHEGGVVWTGWQYKDGASDGQPMRQYCYFIIGQNGVATK